MDAGRCGAIISCKQWRSSSVDESNPITALASSWLCHWSVVLGSMRLILPGGVLVKQPDGTVIGAVGISGDTSEKDEFCAIEAIHAAGLACEPDSPDENWRASSLSGTAY